MNPPARYSACIKAFLAGIIKKYGSYLYYSFRTDVSKIHQKGIFGPEVHQKDIILWSHNRNKIVSFFFADFYHVFHPIEETTIKINNQLHPGVVLCCPISIIFFYLFFT